MEALQANLLENHGLQNFTRFKTGNTHTNLVGLSAHYDQDDKIKTVYVVIYGIILNIGILSNILICILILSLRQLRTAQNQFVLNLCMADIWLGLNGLFAFIEEVDEDWNNDTWLCQLLGFTTFVPPICVVLSMVIIAKNRHACIVKRAPALVFSRKRVRIYLGIVWLISILAAFPILLGFLEVSSGFFCACCFYFTDNLIYGITITVLFYILPNCLIVWYYIGIFRHVHNSRRRIEQHNQRNQQNHAKGNKIHGNETRLAVQFILLFLIFNFCYMPTMIVFWVEKDDKVSYHIRGIVMIIFALNLIANPVAYFILNRAARHVIQQSLCCEFCKKKTSDLSESPQHSNLTTSPVKQGRATEGPQSIKIVTLASTNVTEPNPMPDVSASTPHITNGNNLHINPSTSIDVKSTVKNKDSNQERNQQDSENAEGVSSLNGMPLSGPTLLRVPSAKATKKKRKKSKVGREAISISSINSDRTTSISDSTNDLINLLKQPEGQ